MPDFSFDTLAPAKEKTAQIDSNDAWPSSSFREWLDAAHASRGVFGKQLVRGDIFFFFFRLIPL